jgi:two-component system chemotaxis response regulator CheY
MNPPAFFSHETKILLIEDMPTVQKLLIRQLNEIGLKNIKTSDQPADAWKQISTQQPAFELVICDLTLKTSQNPSNGGKDLLLRLRANEHVGLTAFLMLTVSGESERTQELIQCGSDETLCKPFNPAMLKEKLTQIFQKYSRRKNHAAPKI